ncbi:MAG TPA: hypothetical protein QGG16_09760, partial [Acidimicrobiales bacterium]|nr:hypothetical protein [Acidimicrobiales bacterium]
PPEPSADDRTSVQKLGDDLDECIDRSGIRRVHVLAWRDLEDPEAGGSELHLQEVTSRWANAGLEV